ncbi:MAG: ribosomal-processing cysteine protease Prp [Mycoplasmatales bacterium]
MDITNNTNEETIHIHGHAKYSDYGNDIVCAGISMLTFTIANQILKIDSKFDIFVDENDITLKNNKSNHDINLLIETLKTGFNMVNDEYSKHIKITIK